MHTKKNILYFLLLISTKTWAATCTLTLNSAVAFGSIDPLSKTATISNGALAVACSGVGGTPAFTLTLSPGNSGSFPQRYMLSSGNKLNYNLYTSASLSSIWGDGSAGTGYISKTTACTVTSPCKYTVYGSVPGSQTTVPTGTYADTVTTTLTY